jgi:hypothetical protein
LAQLAREEHVRLVVVVVGDVPEPLSLTPQGGDHIRVPVSERGDGDSRVEVEVTLAGSVPDSPALAAHQHERGLAVVGIEIALTDLDQSGLFFGGHPAGLARFST